MDKKMLVNAGGSIEAGGYFLEELDKSFPVEFAFWRRDRDERHAYLYVASKKITDENMRAAYGEVHRIVDTLTDFKLDPFRIHLLAWNNPSTELAVSQFQATGEVMDIFVGPEVVEEVFLYPIGVAAQPTKTRRRS